MRPYFLNVDKSERQNILDLHKTPYDGYVTRQGTSNTQPLMVQDFANDKGGITVKSNGEVSEYNNKIYMRESSGECNECGYNEMEELDEEPKTCNECGLYEEVCECGRGYMEESYDEEFFTNVEDPDNFMSSGNYGEIDYDINSEDEISEPFVDDVDNEENDIDMIMLFTDDNDEPEFDREIDLGKPKANSQLDKTLDMFKRFQKY